MLGRRETVALGDYLVCRREGTWKEMLERHLCMLCLIAWVTNPVEADNDGSAKPKFHDL